MKIVLKIKKKHLKRLVSISQGRLRNEMYEEVKSKQDRIQEHLWKLFAYHEARPLDVAGWLKTLNKYLPRFWIYNVQKDHSKRKNMDHTALEDLLVTELFEFGDIDVLNSIWKAEGFPDVWVTPDQARKLQELAQKYIKCILTPGRKLSVTTSELL